VNLLPRLLAEESIAIASESADNTAMKMFSKAKGNKSVKRELKLNATTVTRRGITRVNVAL